MPRRLLTLEGGSASDSPVRRARASYRRQPVTTATDVYALGVLLYLLLTGQHPAGPGPHSPAELVKAIAETRTVDGLQTRRYPRDAEKRQPKSGATTPDKLRRELRGDLDTIVVKALKKNPQERYASVDCVCR